MHAVDRENIQKALDARKIEANVLLVEGGTKLRIEIGVVAGTDHYWLGGFLGALQATGFPFETNVSLPY